MADATQVQIRRDTAANLAVTTPVEAELGYDQTNKRILIGDGSTAAGIPHVNYNDGRIGAFQRGTVGGTANAITLTLSPAALSYQTGMEIWFLASGTNTGSTTIDIDGLGTRTIQKLKAGSLQNLEAGDLVSGVFYKTIYNGTNFQLTTLYSSGLESVSQGNLNTSTGTFSTTTSILAATTGSGSTSGIYISSSSIASPGGQYGFEVESYGLNTTTYKGWFSGHSALASYGNNFIAFDMYRNSAPTPGGTVQGRQRYITSSPPFDLGDGETGGFIFALVNSSGDVVSHYAADVPPWGYNGPTNIRADFQCPVTKKKFRKVTQNLTYEQIMDGAKPKLKLQEITQKIKNADMGLIPHPFGEVPEGHHVVLLDPMDDKIRRTIEYQNQGGVDWVEALRNGKIQIGDECKRCGPKGVHIHKMKYKFASKF